MQRVAEGCLGLSHPERSCCGFFHEHKELCTFEEKSNARKYLPSMFSP
jgi:hypothetical protein